MENLSLEVLKPQFLAILENQSNFVVDFDLIWRWLGYSRKDKAKECLIKNFSAEIDYKVFHHKVENFTGGRPQQVVYVTKDCFKSFCMISQTPQGKEIRLWYLQIEKEWREMKASKPKSNLEALLEVVNQLVEHERRQKQLEAQLALEATRVDRLEELVVQHDAELDRVFNPNGSYFSILGYAKLKGFNSISSQEAARLGKLASNLCKKMDLPITKVKDARYGEIGTYPESVLNQIFSS